MNWLRKPEHCSVKMADFGDMFKYVDRSGTSYFDVTYKNTYYQLSIIDMDTGTISFYIYDKDKDPDVKIKVL